MPEAVTEFSQLVLTKLQNQQDAQDMAPAHHMYYTT